MIQTERLLISVDSSTFVTAPLSPGILLAPFYLYREAKDCVRQDSWRAPSFWSSPSPRHTMLDTCLLSCHLNLHKTQRMFSRAVDKTRGHCFCFAVLRSSDLSVMLSSWKSLSNRRNKSMPCVFALRTNIRPGHISFLQHILTKANLEFSCHRITQPQFSFFFIKSS